MRWIEVKKGNNINGEVSIPGSKNSSLPILTACCLSDGVVTLKNVPHISDVQVIYDIFSDMEMTLAQDQLISI